MLIALSSLAAALLLSGPTPTPQHFDEDLETLAAWLVGRYNTSDQVEADQRLKAKYQHANAVLLIVPVSLPGFITPPGARVLYLEQALKGSEEAPYRQRVLTLYRDSDGLLTTRTYRISSAQDLVGASRDRDKLKHLLSDRLTPEPGCDAKWTKVDRFLYKGVGGRDRGCKSTVSGATYVTTYADVTADTLISLDQGFDDSGSQKWGPPQGVAGHIFHKQRD